MSLDKIVYIELALLCLLSGSVVFFVENSLLLVPIYLFFALIIYHLKGVKISKENKLLFFGLFFWQILVNFVIYTDHRSNLHYVSLLFLASSFLFVSVSDFQTFREKLLKCLTVLTLISIVIQLLHDFGFMSPNAFGGGIPLTFYLFNCDWGEYRLASVFWEPGQYQILIIFILSLFTDELGLIQNFKKNIRKFGILIVGLVFTISTTGYLSLIILIFGSVLYSLKNRRNFFIRILYIIFFVGVFFLIYGSRAIQEKLDQTQSLGKTSYSIRLDDNVALLRTAQDSPIFGFGTDTYSISNKASKYGSLSSSNGWLYCVASLGLPFLLCLWIIIYRRLKDIPNGINHFILLFALIVSQSNEYYVFFPYLYMYIFKFNSYNLQKENKCQKI